MAVKFLLIFLTVIQWKTCPAQITSVKRQGKYLGQKPPGMKPEIFAPGLISTKYYEHSAPAFSPDGKTVLWTVLYPYPKPAVMLEMSLNNGQWTMPSLPSFADTTADDFYPSFAPDGKKLYFSSRRKAPAGYPASNGIRIWEVAKTPHGWGTPMPLDTTVFKVETYAHSITSKGNVYCSRRGRGGGMFDIDFFQKNNSEYHNPETLPYNINTKWYEDGPFIAPDESYLIFESDRPGGMEASIDLYISFRRTDGKWTPAKNMGPNVNSKFTERFARVSPDGKYLFFGSDRDPSPGAQGTDVYWVDAKVIDQLKKQVMRENENSTDKYGNGIMPASYNGDHAKAAQLLKDWLNAYPKDVTAYIDYISALRKSQQYTEAEMKVKNWQGPLNDSTHLKLELALVKFGLNKDAEAETIISSFPADAEHRGRLVRMASELHITKNYKEAAAFYELALKIQPRAIDYYNMACAYSLQGEKDKSFYALNKAADLGYNERVQYETDSDLDPLKTDERYQILMNRLVPNK